MRRGVVDLFPVAQALPPSGGVVCDQVDDMEREALRLVEPVCVFTPHGDILYKNAAYGALAPALGVRRIGAIMRGALDEITRTGAPVERRDRVRIGDEDRDIKSKFVPFRSTDGELIAVAGQFQDVTELLRARQQIGVLQTRLYDITRLVSDWVWETDRDLRFVFVSRRTTEVMGLLPYEVTGKSLLELGRFSTSTGEPVDLPEEIQRHTPFRNLFYAVPTRDGRLHLFQFSGLPVFDDETGEFQGYRGTASDVTSEAEAERRVADTQSNLEEAIDSIDEGFALFDEQDRLILCNDKFRAFFPKVAGRLVAGMQMKEWVRIAIRGGDVLVDDPETYMRQRIKSWQKPANTFEVQLADGRWLRCTDRKTDRGRTVAIRTDITELKKREQALMSAKQMAEMADKSKSQFLSSVSHELRTPLNAIIGFAELLEAQVHGELGDQRYQEYIQEIRASGRHLLTVINDILEVAQAEAGQLQLHEELTDPDSIFTSALRQMQEAASRSRVSLVGPTEALPVLYVDGRKLRQLLTNVLDNAIKFTPPGGKVVMTADINDEGEFVLTVVDSGKGIAPEDLEVALRPFGQVDGGLTRKFTGTGIGLPLAKALVELHGGRLTLASELGVGTTVNIFLPSDRVHAKLPG